MLIIGKRSEGVGLCEKEGGGNLCFYDSGAVLMR